MFCDKCGKELPENAAFCDNCGEKITMSPNHVDETDMFDMGQKALEDVPVKNRKRSTMVVGVVAVLVFAVLIVAILVKIFGGNGASTKLVDAAQDTVMNGAEFKIKVKVDDEESVITGFYTIDTKNSTAEIAYKKTYQNYYDEEIVDEIALRMEEDDIYIYDAMSYDGEQEYENANKYSLKDLKKEQDIDVDSELIFGLLKDLSKKDIEKIDYEKWLEEFDVVDYIEDYIEPKDVNKAVEAVLKALDKNAEECLGYEKDGNTVSYDIDVYDTLMVAVEAIEKYMVDEDDYEDLMDLIKDNKSYIKEIDNIEAEITYDGKYISEVVIKVSDTEIEITFENIGKCDESYMSKIEKALKDSEEE